MWKNHSGHCHVWDVTKLREGCIILEDRLLSTQGFQEQSSCSLDLLMSYITRKGRHYEHKAHPLLWQPTRSGFSAPPQGGHWDTELVAQGSRALDWFTYYLSFQHKKLKAAKCYQKSAKINAESKKKKPTEL